MCADLKKSRVHYGADRFTEDSLTVGEKFHAVSPMEGYPFLVSFLCFDQGHAVFKNLEPNYSAMYPTLRFFVGEIHRYVFNFVLATGEVYEQ